MASEQRITVAQENAEKLVAVSPDPISIVTLSGLELIETFVKDPTKLADTSYATWTPSTTAKVIVAANNAGTFTAEDIDKHDYFVRTRWGAEVAYKSGTAVANGMFDKVYGENWYAITRRPSDASNMDAGTSDFNLVSQIISTWATRYYSSGWNLNYAQSNGFYASPVAHTLGSTSATSPTITIRRPSFYAKCNATYFSTGMAANVDQDKSEILFKYDVYRARGGYSQREVYDGLIDMWQNGL